MKKNVIFIGFMGAGKTTIAKAYAKAMRMPLFDTDQMIEQEAGMTISEIFATQGETRFREIETAVLEKLLAETDGAVISVGGGLPLLEKNREMLKRLGVVVFLSVKKETVLQRLKGDTTRPLLQGDHVEQKIEELLAYRNPLYEDAAHLIVCVDDRGRADILNEVKEKTACNL